jgi:hypothetical protein
LLGFIVTLHAFTIEVAAQETIIVYLLLFTIFLNNFGLVAVSEVILLSVII